MTEGLVDRLALEHGLDVALVKALIAQESGGQWYAWRPEPRFRYFVDCRTGLPFRHVTPDELASKVAPPDFPYFAGGRDQEWLAQSASWGPMQIMGAVARERGFRAPYLPELCDMATNLKVGCTLLRSLLLRFNGDEALALGAYNAGVGGAHSAAGQNYAARVLARRTALG